MSHSTLYEIRPTKVKVISEYKNSWLGAMFLWDFCARHYCGIKEGFPLFDTMRRQQVWDCYKNPGIPLHMRAAMALTLDYIVIQPDECQRIGELLLRVPSEFILRGIDKATHWDCLGRDVAAWKPKGPHASKVIGLALNATSVNDIWSPWPRTKSPLTPITELLNDNLLP
jgi:hypothetical protein